MINELIRKTDVLDLLNDLANDFGDNYALYSTLFDSVDGMEAANVEKLPKTGRWECVDDDANVYKCTACGEEWYLEAGTPDENNMRFCSCCGTKMKGETE